MTRPQPPSGGCVLKLVILSRLFKSRSQPPSGGCVLKPLCFNTIELMMSYQPPSGGCVLKLMKHRFCPLKSPAAFGRLCVETIKCCALAFDVPPAAFGRLCVETFEFDFISPLALPAAFGRLCVETR